MMVVQTLGGSTFEQCDRRARRIFKVWEANYPIFGKLARLEREVVIRDLAAELFEARVGTTRMD